MPINFRSPTLMLSSFLMFYLYYSCESYSIMRVIPYFYNRLTRVSAALLADRGGLVRAV